MPLRRIVVSPRARAFAACGALVCSYGCGDDGAPASRPDSGDAVDAADGVGDVDPLDVGDDPHTDPYVAPTVAWPDDDDDRPFALSEIEPYLADGAPAPDLVGFAPAYTLWADDLGKARWLRLPPGAVIDDADPDAWKLPIGAVVFKDFGPRGGARLETRVIARIGPGPFDYWMGAFVWRADGSDADFVRAGAVDVGGSDHDVPDAERCWGCHVGTPGRVLGLTTVQLAAPGAEADALAPHLATPLPDDYTTPGDDAATAAALGYLHANCAHCHSPVGVARPDTDIDLSLSAKDGALEATGVWRTAVGVATRSWLEPEVPLRIAPGDPDHSAVVVRMGVRGNNDQMPPLATEHQDQAGLTILRTWIAGLTPAGPE